MAVLLGILHVDVATSNSLMTHSECSTSWLACVWFHLQSTHRHLLICLHAKQHTVVTQVLRLASACLHVVMNTGPFHMPLLLISAHPQIPIRWCRLQHAIWAEINKLVQMKPAQLSCPLYLFRVLQVLYQSFDQNVLKPCFCQRVMLCVTFAWLQRAAMYKCCTQLSLWCKVMLSTYTLNCSSKAV